LVLGFDDGIASPGCLRGCAPLTQRAIQFASP
jgi:hypothetical protein